MKYKLLIKKRHVFVLTSVSIFYIGICLLGWFFFENLSIPISIGIALFIILFIQTVYFLRLNHFNTVMHKDLFTQIESILSIFYTIKPELPFPNTRGWAASPDFLKELVAIILSKKPEYIVELSSGSSSLIAAYCLKLNKKGTILSLEHDQEYRDKTLKHISFHGFNEISSIVHTPLKEITIEDKKYHWYDISAIKFSKPIDILVIDGPPMITCPLARYPALPLLFSHLNDECIILLDDGKREDERKTVDLWCKKFPDFHAEYLSLEKGAFILRRR